MRVVLRHATHPGQTVDDAGLLVPVHRAEFEQPQRQLAVGPAAGPEDEVVHRAVHRLEVVVLARLAHGAVLGQFLVDVHRGEHAVAVPVEMAGHLVEVTLRDVRGVHELVAGLDMPLAGVVLHLLADDAALGVEHREAGAELVGEAEQVELVAELAVITALGLGEQLEVALLRLRGLPRGAVDALETGIVLVAAPIGGGAAGELERRDVLGGGDVRTAAQIGPDLLAGARIEVVVDRQFLAADLHDLGVLVQGAVSGRLLADQLELERLVLQFLACVVQALDDAAGEPLRPLDDLLHALLELRQVLGSEGAVDLEVVVEAVLDRGTDAELGLGELLLHRLGEDVCRGVPDDGAAVLGGGGDRLDLGVLFRRPRQVPQPPLLVADHDDRVGPAVGQARLPEGGTGSGPRGHPDEHGGVYGCGRRHCGGLLGLVPVMGAADAAGYATRPATRPCYRHHPERQFTRALPGVGRARADAGRRGPETATGRRVRVRRRCGGR